MRTNFECTKNEFISLFETKCCTGNLLRISYRTNACGKQWRKFINFAKDFHGHQFCLHGAKFDQWSFAYRPQRFWYSDAFCITRKSIALFEAIYFVQLQVFTTIRSMTNRGFFLLTSDSQREAFAPRRGNLMLKGAI